MACSGNFAIDLDFLVSDELYADDTLTQLLNIETQNGIKPEENVSERFVKPLSSDEIKTRNNEAIPKKTRQSNKWALGVWRQWVQYRNTQPESILEPGYPIPEDIGNLDDKSLDFWGQRFIMEIRIQDGQDYPPNTLTQLVSGLQRYLRTECSKAYVNFFKEDDTKFAGFRKALDTKMKELQSEGKGCKRNSADPVTREEEATFWKSDVFSMDNGTGLSNAVFFYNGKIFGFRGFQEHVDCKAEQFEIGFDKENEHRYIKYTPYTRKNYQGGLKSRKVNNDPILHYENKDVDFSLVDLYVKYLSLIPSIGAFYRKPLNGTDENNNPKFSCSSISQASIKCMLKKFYEEAGISTEGRKITNHSARVTLCTSLYNQNFTDKAVTSRSKHRSDSVHGYQREQFAMLKNISNALEPPSSKSTKRRPEASPLPPPDVAELSKQVSVKRLPEASPLPPPHVAELSKQVSVEPDNDHTPLHVATACENELVISLPNSIQRVVLVKSDGKRMVLDI